ncbi:MAG: DUF1285 domain-containing protein [Alphaproteobacteria bacterium]
MGTDTNNPQGLFERIGKTRSLAPSRREPVDCGHFDMRIGRDGTWYYRGSPIGRKPLVTLFSSVLKRDKDGQYWLETPVERGRIDVDDAPFTAVEMDVTGQGRDQKLIFRTNLDETVTAGAENPLRIAFDESSGEPSPYIHVRDGLEALLTRAVYYQLADLAVADPDRGLFGVWSGGMFFALEQAGERTGERLRP